jgi:hypothetical protein
MGHNRYFSQEKKNSRNFFRNCTSFTGAGVDFVYSLFVKISLNIYAHLTPPLPLSLHISRLQPLTNILGILHSKQLSKTNIIFALFSSFALRPLFIYYLKLNAY